MTEEKWSAWVPSPSSFVPTPVQHAYDRLAEWHGSLGLLNPGTVENISKEVSKDVLANNHFFSGARADLTKTFSVAPLSQLVHSFTAGSSQPPYGFVGLFGTDKLFMQGNVDNEGSVNARLHYGWNARAVTKIQTQSASDSAASGIAPMFSIEQDYQAPSFSFSTKLINPFISSSSSSQFTGMLISSYLQSLTPRLSVGFENVYSRQDEAAKSESQGMMMLGQPQIPEFAMSYMARYNAGDWVTSVQLQPTTGMLIGSYWRRLSDKCEAAVECQVMATNGAKGVGPGMMMTEAVERERGGLTTMGVKYEFRGASVRMQINSQGDVGFVTEKRLTNVLSLSFSGKIDQFKNKSAFGVAVSIESGGLDESAIMEQPQASPPA